MSRYLSFQSEASFTLIVVLFCLIGPGAHPDEANGVPFNKGDVFAGVGNGKIKHSSPDGVLLDTLDTATVSDDETGMAFDLDGNLYDHQGRGGSLPRLQESVRPLHQLQRSAPPPRRRAFLSPCQSKGSSVSFP